MAELDVLEYTISQVNKEIDNIKKDLKEINIRLELYYLTIKQYENDIKPMRNIVYGMVALVLISVFTAIIYTVINKG